MKSCGLFSDGEHGLIVPRHPILRILEYLRGMFPQDCNVIKGIDIFGEISEYNLIIGQQTSHMGVSELESMSLGIPTLFPFGHSDAYSEPLPMPETSAKNIQKYFGDHELGRSQKEWVCQNHGAEGITNKLL